MGFYKYSPRKNQAGRDTQYEQDKFLWLYRLKRSHILTRTFEHIFCYKKKKKKKSIFQTDANIFLNIRQFKMYIVQFKYLVKINHYYEIFKTDRYSIIRQSDTVEDRSFDGYLFINYFYGTKPFKYIICIHWQSLLLKTIEWINSLNSLILSTV